MITRCWGVVNGHAVEFQKDPNSEDTFNTTVPWSRDLQDMIIHVADDQGREAEFTYSSLIEKSKEVTQS